MEELLRPSRQVSPASKTKDMTFEEKNEHERCATRDTEILNTMWKMVACGLGSVAAGFLIWNLDNIYCGTLRRWRREVGLPWGILLEGHGWW